MQRIKARVAAILFAATMATALFVALPMMAYGAVTDLVVGGAPVTPGTDDSGTGWEWIADDKTLILDANYEGAPLSFTVNADDIVIVEVESDISINGIGTEPAISFFGNDDSCLLIDLCGNKLEVTASPAATAGVIDVSGIVEFDNGQAKVTNTDPHGYGILTGYYTYLVDAVLYVTGNVGSDNVAIAAIGADSNAFITGSAEAGLIGVYAIGGAYVEVTDGIAIYSGGEFGVYADTGATVTVTGGGITISGDDCYGVYATSFDTAVFVTGDVVVSSMDSCCGLYADGYAQISLTGNVLFDSALHGSPVMADTGANININGNVTSQTYGVNAQNISTISISGNVETGFQAVVAYTKSRIDIGGNVKTIGGYQGDSAVVVEDAEVNILGNIEATGVGGIGVLVQWDGQVTVDGTITADTYISFGDIKVNGVSYSPYTVTAADYDASSIKPGYLQYSITYLDDQGVEHTDYVWVTGVAAEVDISTVPATGDSMAVEGGAAVLMLALAGAAALAWRRSVSKHLL